MHDKYQNGTDNIVHVINERRNGTDISKPSRPQPLR